MWECGGPGQARALPVCRSSDLCQCTRPPPLLQASTRLAQCQALGPRFEALAREHAEVVQRIGETQYQLQEVEQFAQLQQVIG